MNRIGNRKKEFGHSAGGVRLGLAFLLPLVFLGVAGLTPSSVWADDADQGAPSTARLSSVDGKVRIVQGGQVLADPAPLNAPLLAGTQVETGDDGKAEIQFEDGSVARLAPGSALTLTALGGQAQGGQGGSGSEIALDGGLGYFELQGGQSGQMRVLFGDSLVTVTGFTVMRIKMDTPPGSLAVLSGNAHLERGNALSVDLHGGESVALNGTDPSRYDLAETVEPDSWDAWNSDRDQALSNEATEQTGATSGYSNGNSAAWNDLDANGNWYNVPGQGYVWSPYDAEDAGFDPYGNGDWMWTPGYGYMFASAYSWGYLPYHCGLWNYYNGFGWGWSAGMDGSHSWRGTGRYGGVNIGIAPPGYRRLVRPVTRAGNSVIAVNRAAARAVGGLPVRSKMMPAEIAGYMVQPLRPLPSQQRYESSASGFVYRSVQAYQGTKIMDGQASGGTHPAYSVRPAYAPQNTLNLTPAYTHSTQSSAPPSHSSAPAGGGSFSRPSAPIMVSRPMSSGGGSSHSSGGGGGSHSSGGGHR